MKKDLELIKLMCSLTLVNVIDEPIPSMIWGFMVVYFAASAIYYSFKEGS